MTIPATFESVSERGSSQHVAGLVVQWNVDGRVVADVPAEWLGLAEAPNAPRRPVTVTGQTVAAGAFCGASPSSGFLDGDSGADVTWPTYETVSFRGAAVRNSFVRKGVDERG